MLLENLTESQLNEIFDAGSLGTVYPVDDLTPKAKVPQMLHIKVPGTKDLIIRLTHLDTVGTRVKAVMPGDKTVQVFLMSLSDKGNITDFRGGLGSDPIGAINTIFTTVMEIAKKYKFEAVLFRFAKTKMKGQTPAVTRILNRLIQNRSAGRFMPVEEVTRAESKKFGFVLAQKKNSHILDNITPPDNFEKVETKAGDTFIDKDSGKQVSKAEVIAAAIVSKAEKITDQSVIAKTKLSRKAAMAAMYSYTDGAAQRTEAQNELLIKYTESAKMTPATGRRSKIQDAIDQTEKNLANDVTSKVDKKLMELIKFNKVFDELGGDKAAEAFHAQLVARIEKIWMDADWKDLQTSFVKIAEVLSEPPLGNLRLWQRQNMLSAVLKTINDFTLDIMMAKSYKSDEANVDNLAQYTEEQRDAIRDYTSQHFEEINGFLQGSLGRISDKGQATVTNLDAAFENGSTLAKGTVLYRGQNVPLDAFKMMIEGKMIYFKQFVSASLRPLLYNPSYGDLAPNLDTQAREFDSYDEYMNTPGNLESSHKDYLDSNFQQGIERIRIGMGIVIRDAHKINVVIPGTMSQWGSEAEVILPRGTILKIVKSTGEAADKSGNSRVMIDAVVVSPESLTEGMEVLDGDTLFTEGKAKPVEGLFSKMFDGEVLNEAEIISDNQSANDLLVSMIDLDNMPAKFIS